MHNNINIGRKPEIRNATSEHARLTVLAGAVADRNPEASDGLLAELERARIVADGAVSDKTVRMGSAVTYETDAGETRTVTLVFPGEADIAQGKISILTPIGTALIGLSAGQAIGWVARDGRRHRLSVLAVAPASAAIPA